jgi:hypothetical protein
MDQHPKESLLDQEQSHKKLHQQLRVTSACWNKSATTE